MFNFEKVSSVGREEIWIFLVNVAGGGGGVGERERGGGTPIHKGRGKLGISGVLTLIYNSISLK